MKRVFLLASVIILGFSVYSQQITEESLVINVEVPLRVFKGDKFVDNLTIDDFEVFEEGIRQKIEAVYLVRGRAIERSEEKKRFAPKTSRNFFLFFEISEYSPMLGDAVNYFVKNVVFPEDKVTIVTPMKTYRMRGITLEIKSREQTANDLNGILKRDVFMGYSEYWNLMSQLEEIAQALSSEAKGSRIGSTLLTDTTPIDSQDVTIVEKLKRYSNILTRIENLRRIDQQKLLDFARFLKDKEGQKHVFILYQREFIPEIDPESLSQYREMYQNRPDILQTLLGLFEFYKREINFDVDLVKQAYADSSISIHFLFIPTPIKHISGIWFEEHSEDFYTAFKEIAQATGGFAENSANPAFSFKKAVEASENYYLLYYLPLNYKRDGKFKEIKVRVKNKDYRVTHRAGYFAN